MPRVKELCSSNREGGTTLLYRSKENHSRLAQKPYASGRSTWELLFVPFMANTWMQMQVQGGSEGASDVLRST